MAADDAPLRDRRGYVRPPQSRPGHRKGEPNVRAGLRYPPVVLTRSDVLALLEACDSTVYGFRLRALLGLLYRTRATIEEALTLRLADLVFVPGLERAYFHGSKLRNRWLALDDELLTLMAPWLDQRRQLPGKTVFCVVTGPTEGRKWDSSSARKALREVSDSVLNRRVHFQGFRYALAAEMIVEQWPLTYIQAQLGLTSVHGFRDLFANLGIQMAPDEEVAEVAKARPLWRSVDMLAKRTSGY